MKRELMEMLYAEGESFKVFVRPAGCVLPKHLMGVGNVALEIGWALVLPVLDFTCTDAEFSCTLRFGRDLFAVRVPLDNVAILESDDSITFFAQTVNEPEPPAERRGLRVIKGGKTDAVATEPMGAA